MAAAALRPPAAAAAAATPRPPPPSLPATKSLSAALLSAAAAASVLLSPPPLLAAPPPPFFVYYGTASSAANYGGYGGNQSKRDTAEYSYEVPGGWKERPVSKVEKGTNGTDSEFFNPRRRAEREYLTALAGVRALAPLDAVLGDLALSDVGLQDLVAAAESVAASERRDAAGQAYYEYEIAGGSGERGLISVTCARNKLYAHFVRAPRPDWERDEEALRRIHRSFRTMAAEAPPP